MLFGLKYVSPLGEMLIVSDENSIIGAWFDDQKYFKNKIEDTIVFSDVGYCKLMADWLDNYFQGNKPEISSLILAPIGTRFQKDVWQELLKIPYGETRTYSEISSLVAQKYHMNKMSARAVGVAISKNPISILIPCHRVIGKNGKLTGYAGGLKRKSWLLEFEERTSKNQLTLEY